MAFGDTLALINGDRPQPSFTGITGRKAGYTNEDSSADEREQPSKSE